MHAISQDLDMNTVLANVWKLAKDTQLGNLQKRALLLDFDRVLRLGVADWERQALPQDLRSMIELR